MKKLIICIVCLGVVLVAWAAWPEVTIETFPSSCDGLADVSTDNSPISYQIKDETENQGGKVFHIYSLSVKNNSDRDLYVYGKVHLLGTVQRRPFRGAVPAYSKKSIFSTIDEKFEVEEIYYQDNLGL